MSRSLFFAALALACVSCIGAEPVFDVPRSDCEALRDHLVELSLMNASTQVRWLSSIAGNKPLYVVSGDLAPADTEATYRAQHDSSYARYQKLLPGEDAAWRVLTPDGMTYYFGEGSHLENDGNLGGIDAPPHFFPLTSMVDPFGNTVIYTWHVDTLPETNGSPRPFATRTIRLDHIRKTMNEQEAFRRLERYPA